MSFGDSWIGAFNSFRLSYNRMPFTEVRKFTEAVVRVFLEQKRYNFTNFDDFFHNIENHVSVLELGGYNGQLACEILPARPHITSWTNYEMCHTAQICFDQRYIHKTLDDWIWTIDDIPECNTFVSSHVIEHMSFEHFKLLIAWLPQCIRNIYIEAPLNNNMEANWENYMGTHVMTESWNDIQRHMETTGFYLWYITAKGVAFKRLERLCPDCGADLNKQTKKGSEEVECAECYLRGLLNEQG